MEKWIYYYCYGSNMLTSRMRLNNKSATKFSLGILQNYKLAFSGHSTTWAGASANIVPAPNSTVIGVIYKLSQEDIANLDRQEVGYNAIEVEVHRLDAPPTDGPITCRTYVQKPEYQSTGDEIPSKLYKDVILKGAEEHQLPQNYIDNVIKAFRDNGRTDCGPAGFVL